LLNDRGSTLVESVFGLTLLLLAAIAIVQVALVMYARNVMAAAAHEGARLAVERGAQPEEARALALGVIEGVAGGLVDNTTITSGVSGDRLTLRVSGSVDSFGPLPLGIPVAEQVTVDLFEDP
jgi:hypothetical protein